MKLSWIAFLGILLCGYVHAEEMNSLSFSLLQQKFQQGGNVAVENAKGFRTGRCFDRHSPDMMLNGLLIYEKSPSQPGSHNLSTPRFFNADYMAVAHHQDKAGRALPSNYADSYRWRQDEYAYWPIQSLWDGYLNPTEIKDTVTWLDGDVRYTVRSDQSNIIVESNNLKAGQALYSMSLGKFVPEEAGPLVYCYFFKSL